MRTDDERTDAQNTTLHALISFAGAKWIGEHLGMPIVEDRAHKLFAITPVGGTLRAVKIR